GHATDRRPRSAAVLRAGRSAGAKRHRAARPRAASGGALGTADGCRRAGTRASPRAARACEARGRRPDGTGNGAGADGRAGGEGRTRDGWRRTGDIGASERDGLLRVGDRKKDLIVTSGGKNIAPQKLEGALRADPLISEALVVGDRRRYLVALIAPDLGEVRRLDLPRDELERRIGEAVARVNARVGKTERIARHAVLDRQVSQEHG